MKNQAPELERQRYGVAIKDKRALVLFLFGALMLIDEVPWPMHERAAHQYALVTEENGRQPTARLIRLIPHSVISDSLVLLDPLRPIGENVPARYALFLQQPLPINRADRKSLQLLPGVGPYLDKLIPQYIDTHGPLTQPEELLQVAGIGPKTLERLSPFIRLDQRAAQP